MELAARFGKLPMELGARNEKLQWRWSLRKASLEREVEMLK